MSERKVSFALHEYYHLYNRGNSKQIIFKDKLDYQRFQMCLYIANGTNSFVFREVKKNDVFDFERGEQLVHIGAYCLMPNHFHILLTPAVEKGVQTFMQKLSVGYAMYFNKKYERTGGLFEGRFKSEHADSDEYLKYLFSYIHLNPVKLIQSDWKEEGIADPVAAFNYLESYGHSSFSEYLNGNYASETLSEGPTLGKRKEEKILNREAFPEYFTSPKEFRSELLEWLQYNKLPELT